MQKTIEHAGVKATITIKENSHGEKHPGGTRYYSVQVVGVGNQYKRDYEIDTTSNLAIEIDQIEQEFIAFFSDVPQSPFQSEAESLGFK